MAMENNTYYQDLQTKCIKIATHISFDEAGYTLPSNARTYTQNVLQHHIPSKCDDNIHLIQGDSATDSMTYSNGTTDTTHTANVNRIHATTEITAAPVLQVKLLIENGILPTRATSGAAGYNVYSATTITIDPNTMAKVTLDIAVTPLVDTYCQLLSHIVDNSLNTR
jgi:hypothetical protein